MKGTDLAAQERKERTEKAKSLLAKSLKIGRTTDIMVEEKAILGRNL
jgi:hypothetical protein